MIAPMLTEIASGLRFPEGPIAMDDGSVLLVEMFGPRLTRIKPDGTKQTIAEVPGGPNGAAIGPDGAVYLCNNGGCFTPLEMGSILVPGPFDPARYTGGRIQRVELATGKVEDLYTHCDGLPLRAPNDLVFDAHGGFYFTDHGIRDHHARTSDLTGIYYAKADGSQIKEVVFPVEGPNGIGLSPDGKKLYWAETQMRRVLQRRITNPGEIAPAFQFDPSLVLCGLPGSQMLDSLAVDAEGHICVATLGNGGITVVAPDSGKVVTHVPTGDPGTTNLCFGGADLSTAYITLGATGKLVSMRWPRPGLKLSYNA